MSQEAWNNPEETNHVPGMENAPSEEAYGRPRARPNNSTLALVAAFLTALGVLYLLRVQNQPRAATAEEAQHAQDIDKRFNMALASVGAQHGVGDFVNDTRGLVERLNSYFNHDVSPSDLPRNPFEHVSAHVAAIDDGFKPIETPTGPTPEQMSAEAELRAAAQEFAGLRLQMVMLGNPSSALINDHLVQPGARFKYLEVGEIHSDSVVLKYKDKKYLLSSQPQEKH